MKKKTQNKSKYKSAVEEDNVRIYSVRLNREDYNQAQFLNIPLSAIFRNALRLELVKRGATPVNAAEKKHIKDHAVRGYS